VGLLERDAQLAALRSCWADAVTGRGRFVFVGGESGAGKTSVAFELARRLAGRARFLVGVCDAGATPRPQRLTGGPLAHLKLSKA
jgi:predicted ATPase